MALHGVREQDRLDRASNFVVWKAKILSMLDRNHVNNFALKTIVIPVDTGENDKYEEAMERAKSIILDGVKDHVIPHTVEKEMTNEMWEALKNLYQHTFVQRRMLLENQLRSYQMKKGELIDTFLGGLNEIRDQLTATEATPDQELMVKTALNVVSEDWEVFVQSILGRGTLPPWDKMWASLRLEEIKRQSKMGSSSKGIKFKKEEEDVALTYEGKQEKRKKKDLPKIKCFHCGEMGHYATQCPRKKSKGESSETKAAPALAEKEVLTDDDCVMSAHLPLERKWGDIEM